jgi:hypothetical protein
MWQIWRIKRSLKKKDNLENLGIDESKILKPDLVAHNSKRLRSAAL